MRFDFPLRIRPDTDEHAVKRGSAQDTGLDRKLLKMLASSYAPERLKAETAISAMGAEGLEALLAVVFDEQRKKREKRVWVVGLFGTFAIIGILGAHELLGHMLNMLGAFAGVLAISTTQKNATVALRHFDSIRCVGPFVDALGYNDKSVRRDVEKELIRLLPRMQASDSHYINDAQRNALNRELDRKSTPQAFVLAILQAWQQVGDEKAIPFVERLVDPGTDESVREAAADCLTFLKIRAEQAAAAATLLRASGSTPAGAGELLRAASGGGETPAVELLRASAEEPVNAPAQEAELPPLIGTPHETSRQLLLRRESTDDRTALPEGSQVESNAARLD